MIDPNKEFKKKKHPYGSPRPYTPLIHIRCDATNCGQQMVVSRGIWISKDVVECPKCGETLLWSSL